MHKRIVSIMLTLIMLITLTACTGIIDKVSTSGEIVSPKPKEEAQLTILLSPIEYEIFTMGYFSEYLYSFEKDFGVKINFQRIGGDPSGLIIPEEQNEYIQKLSTKLFTKDGPELIFAQYMSMEALIKQRAVADLRGKVANLDKLYDGLVGNQVYYAPLGMTYYSRKITKDALVELNVEEPGLDWTSKEYYEIRDKWISKNKVLFNGYEYFMVFRQFIDMDSLYKAGENKIIINTPEVRQQLNAIRDYIFSGKYKLIDGYKYENYYNMVYEDNSQEFKLSQQYYVKNLDNGHIDGGIIANLFRAKDAHYKNISYGTIMYPEFKDREILMNSFGFLVNKNGKNLDLAYEFINGLLSNETQMGLYEDQRDFYPVNKEIEREILEEEAQRNLDPKVIQLKSYALQQLKAGKCKLWITTDINKYAIRTMIERDLAKFTLADEPYTDEQLQVELKKLEDRYNIYLNE